MQQISILFGDDWNRTAFSLSGDDSLWAQTAPTLRGFETEYGLGSHALSSVGRPARELSLELIAQGETGIERLNALMAQATNSLDEGEATISIDGWTQHIRIPKTEANEIKPTMAAVTLTVVLLDGWWIRETEPISVIRREQTDTALDYEFDFEHDFMGLSTMTRFDAGKLESSAHDLLVGLRIYGPCSNPSLTVDGNTFRVDCDVPEGSYLSVDPVSRTVLLTLSNGSVVDVFDKAVRGSGVDSGSYIFQTLKTGSSHELSYGNSFDFDIVPVLRRQFSW